MKLKLKVFLGLVISAVFVYLAFRDVDFSEMLAALQGANYWWLIPAFAFMLLSHWVRAWRWGYFVLPVKKVPIGSLFSALLIGYAANNVFPFRVGEFLRAYAVGKNNGFAKTSAFATVVVERLVDVLSMLTVFGMIILVFRMPENIERTGYVLFVLTIGLMVLLGFLTTRTAATLGFLHRWLPSRLYERVYGAVESFLQGFAALRRAEHYLQVIGTSVIIWLLYGVTVYISFLAFHFVERYDVGFFASYVVLVMVSIGLMIPSSPGFVGTYHWFCMKSLAVFGVPESEALSFAIISHALNTIPFTVIGLFYFWKENLHFSDAVSEKAEIARELESHAVSESKN